MTTTKTDMDKLIVRVTNSEKAKIEAYAAARDMSLTAVTREWIQSLPETYPSMSEIISKVRNADALADVKGLWLFAPPAETSKYEAVFFYSGNDVSAIKSTLVKLLDYALIDVSKCSAEAADRAGAVKLL